MHEQIYSIGSTRLILCLQKELLIPIRGIPKEVNVGLLQKSWHITEIVPSDTTPRMQLKWFSKTRLQMDASNEKERKHIFVK